MKPILSIKSPFPWRFFAITFLWSWMLWLPLALAGAGILPIGKDLLAGLTMPVTAIGAFGPAVGALVSLRTLKGKGAITAYLKTFLDFRFGWRAWIIPIALIIGTTVVAWFTPELAGLSRLPSQLPVIWALPPYWLAMVLFGGGQEEIGWRAYILPHLESRFGPWLGSVMLGTVWACWHLPLWFMHGTNQAFMNFGGFVILALGYSLLFSWVRKAAGTRPLAAMVMHGTANAFIAVFPVLVLIPGATQERFWIWVSLTFAAGILVMAISRLSRSPNNQSPV